MTIAPADLRFQFSDRSGRHSEPAVRILLVLRVEVAILEADVDLEVHIRVFFHQLGLGARMLGPVVGLEPDRQAVFLIDVELDLVKQEVRAALGMDRLDHRAARSPTLAWGWKVSTDSRGEARCPSVP